MRWHLVTLLVVALVGIAPSEARAEQPRGAEAATLTAREALRRSQLLTVRLRAEESELGRKTRERDEARAALEAVAGSIASRKAAGEAASGPLGEELRQSQRLATTLTSLERAVATQRRAVAATTASLVTALEAQLEAERREALPEERRASTARELEALAGAAEASRPLPDARAKDEPEALSARADLLRDQRDRLVRRLAELERRIESKLEEAKVERELTRLTSDGSLFDESGRALRVTPRRPGRVVTGLRGPAPTASGAAPASTEPVIAAPATLSPPPRAPNVARDDGVRDAMAGGALPLRTPLRAAELSVLPSASATPELTELPAPPSPGSLSGSPSERFAAPRLRADAPLPRLEAERARLAAAIDALAREADTLEARSRELSK